ncbi:HD domain-containing protein [Loigolactobacillus backii]|uniref:Phosphohydrolase n=1 Tax=Loigolactobacillus backii TaxID=375175 RepID=A0A192H3W0_9LACO|nr:HD domain-containing protein [Loigolactobacillus backii]ANK59243.1 phosphohydrolase [Loigolactobacillus backii]ANK62656.1 phosphohydrolase [Loigolactobacillus backii]ANK64234.1 phosphohydrolase [Loigolactobacillus backii]ANK67372.1 phosphohydrolase [Loigolactobacillus backii]ANK70336.1 phosphohydrolase [Loigolactobacillus backii]
MTDEQIQKLTQATKYMHQVLDQDTTGHSSDHIERVVRLTRRLCQDEEVPDYLALMAATLHDVVDDKLFTSVSEARQALQQFLDKIAINAKEQAELWQIIDHMSYRKNIDQKQQLSIAGRIVQDADRLDAIGAIGIARTFYFGGHFGEKMYDPQLAPRTKLAASDYKSGESTVINHFYEKLLRLQDQLNTAAAKKIALKRQTRMLNFLTDFKAEWAAED